MSMNSVPLSDEVAELVGSELSPLSCRNPGKTLWSTESPQPSLPPVVMSGDQLPQPGPEAGASAQRKVPPAGVLSVVCKYPRVMSAWYSQMDQLRSSIEQRTSSSCLRVNILRQKNLKISISNLLMLHKYLFMDALYKAG